MIEFALRILISSTIFGIGVIPVFMGVVYPLLFLIMVGLISTILGNVIVDHIWKK